MDKESKKFEIIWDDYSDEEVIEIIKKIPLEFQMKYLIDNQKAFREELKGINKSQKSKRLKSNASKILSKRIRHDAYIRKWIEKLYSGMIFNITKKIFREELNSPTFNQNEYLEKNFKDILNKFPEDMLEKDIYLYFKFIRYEISSDQQRIINQFVLKKEIKKELEERLKADLVKDFDEKFDKVKEEILFLKREKSQELESIKDELTEAIQERDLAIESIENNTNDLGNQISKINEVVEILERDIAQYQNTIEEHQEIIDVLKIKQQEQDKLILELNEEKQNSKTWEEQFIELDNKLETQIEMLKTSVEKIQNLPLQNPADSTTISHNKEQSIVYIKQGTKVAESESSKEIYDFHDCLADNYENIGVKKDNSYNLAYYTAGILETNLIPLIIGFRSRDIATAITAAYIGEKPVILKMPSGYTDSHNLIKLFNSIESHSVLIEDVIGNGNENSLIPLLKNCISDDKKNKFLLLSAEDEEALKFVPRYILNYCAIIKPEHTNLAKPNFKYSDARHLFMESKLEDKVIRKYKKKIEKLVEDIPFASHYDFVKGALFANIEKLKYQDLEKEKNKHLNSKIFPDLFLREIKSFCSESELESIERNLKNCDEQGAI